MTRLFCIFDLLLSFTTLIDRSRIFLDSQKVPQEISALSITPLWPDTHPDSSRIAAVGFWGSNSVSLLSLPSLASLPTADIGLAPSEGHLPRSVLLHTFGNSQSDVASVFILVGLADGTLVTYELDAKSFRVLARRTMLLGNMPLRLTACKHRGSGAGPSGSSSKDQYQNVVFVSGSRPTIVFLENGRLQHSPISLKVRGWKALSVYQSIALFLPVLIRYLFAGCRRGVHV